MALVPSRMKMQKSLALLLHGRTVFVTVSVDRRRRIESSPYFDTARRFPALQEAQPGIASL
jgi:hypothetical protein